MKRTIILPVTIFLMATMALISGCGQQDKEWEKEKTAIVEKHLAAMEGLTYKNLKLDASNKSLSLEDIQGSFTLTEDDGSTILTVKYTIGSFIATGINFSDNPQGFIELADNITFKDFNYQVQYDEAFVRKTHAYQLANSPITIAIKEFTTDKVGMDYNAFMARLSKNSATMSELMSWAESTKWNTFNAKNITAEQWMMNIKTISSIETLSAKYVDKETIENYEGTKIEVIVDDKKTLSIDSFAVKKASVPGIYSAFNSLRLLDPMENPFDLMDIVVDGLSIKGLTFYAPDGNVTIKEIAGDLSKEKNDLVLRSTLSELIIPSVLIEHNNLIGRNLQLTKLHGKEFNISGDIDFSMSRKGEKVSLVLTSAGMAEKTLGGFSMSFDITGKDVVFDEKTGLPDNIGNFYINKSSFTLKDTGMIGLGFTIGAVLQGASPEEAPEQGKALRSQYAVIFPALCAASAGPGFEEYCTAIGRIIGAPGTFESSISPQEPLEIDSLSNMDIKTMGLEWKYTPTK